MKSPVYNVKGIPIEKIKANNYNPNTQASPEFRLLVLIFIPTIFTYSKNKNYISFFIFLFLFIIFIEINFD